MDNSVLAQVLTALAQGAGGQAGQQAWTALTALAGRLPSQRPAGTTATRAGATAEPAHLARALTTRAQTSHEFATQLQEWLTSTQALLTTQGTTNQVTGPVTGTVIQARDIAGGISTGTGTRT